MDQPVRRTMNHIDLPNIEITLPMPVFLIIEDVGWWQGEDGSTIGQPYRNAFPRPHCLADYQVLVRLAERLGNRIGLGMVLGEWDRTNLLKDIPGATWQGHHWQNQQNQGPRLEEAAEYLRNHRDVLELGLHGLCHEFWHQGNMERSEFHDSHGTMRPREVIESHLGAFLSILAQNGFTEVPRLFFPPALLHSFGNGSDSMQAILHQYGMRYVITSFDRAHQFAPPHHERITWECGVGLLDRGISPVPWHVSAALPVWDFSGPILPLHWGNLLHPDANQNNRVAEGWADLLLVGTAGLDRILVDDFDSCWRQMAVCSFGNLFLDGETIVIDLRNIPGNMPGSSGSFFLKVQNNQPAQLSVHGARVLSDKTKGNNIRTLQLSPAIGIENIQVQLTRYSA